ncbi:MAG: helix-turn-helix transcriptional regulator [Lachnospiraceae bacterium]|nr:helix-turn-helix transcriptional regulator [Lachnospiraceae bacterium]
MKLDNVGKQIKALRMGANITREKLCSGLCSNQLLYMIEDGEAPVDLLLLFALLERLGKSAAWLTYILTAKEYDTVRMRDRVEEALRFGQLENAKKVFRKYQKENPAKDNKILCMYEDRIKGILALEQYMQSAAALLDDVRKSDFGDTKKEENRRFALLEGATIYFWNAIQWTVPVKSLLNKGLIHQIEMGNKLLGMTEIENILLYLFVQQLAGKGEEQKKLLLALLHYLEKYMDEVLRAQYLAKTGVLLGELYLKNRDYSACAGIHEKILRLNRKCGMLVCVLPVLDQIIKAYRGLGDERKVEFYTLHKRNLEEIFSDAGVPVECVGKLYYTFRPCQYFVEGKIIAAQRRWMGISQFELSAGIYKSVENLSRIECGKANGDRKKISQIMERLGIDKTRYNGNLIINEYKELGWEQEIEKHLAKRQFNEAGHELYVLEKCVDMEEKCNRQLLLGMKNMEEYRNGKINCEEALQKAKELLEMTYPLEDLDRKEKVYMRLPFRNEMYLFNQVCLLLHKSGRIEEAVERMERMMQKYEGMEEERKFHFKNIHLCEINLCKYLEELDRLEDTEKIADRVIKEKLVWGKITQIHKLFIRKSNIAEKRNENIHNSRKLLQKAYDLSEWCDYEKDSKMLKIALEEVDK